MSEMPETRFTRTGEVDVAYQVVGREGGLDLVFVPGWVSHLEVMWELPEFAQFLDRLAGMGRLILFDKRGTGLSDRVAGTPTLEQRADDIAAVMDAAGSARAAILAWGEGAAIAAMFAAAHPGRVAALVLGTLPVTVAGGRGAVVVDPAVLQALSAAVETSWGQASLVPILAARAVRCACAIRDAVREIGLEIRAGLHTGEVERKDRSVTGVAVHVGARVGALAQASEVLVTNTVDMLVLGSGISFTDRGMHTLKGVPNQWQLFAVDHT